MVRERLGPKPRPPQTLYLPGKGDVWGVFGVGVDEGALMSVSLTSGLIGNNGFPLYVWVSHVPSSRDSPDQLQDPGLSPDSP